MAEAGERKPRLLLCRRNLLRKSCKYGKRVYLWPVIEPKQSNKMNTENIAAVKSLIRNGGTLMNFCGPRNAGLRQRIIELLTGERPPQGKAGINIVEREVYRAANIDVSGHTLSACRTMVDQWANTATA
jgi:hypothetical protein